MRRITGDGEEWRETWLELSASRAREAAAGKGEDWREAWLEWMVARARWAAAERTMLDSKSASGSMLVERKIEPLGWAGRRK
jgi:hypothetical protein